MSDHRIKKILANLQHLGSQNEEILMYCRVIAWCAVIHTSISCYCILKPKLKKKKKRFFTK